MKDDKLYILHMLECSDRIVSYTQEGREAFFQDTKTQDAVVRNFEIIGEAAKRVGQGIRSRAPAIPWTQVAGFRDVLIHQYEGVDLEEVWKRVDQDLPPLKKALEALLKDLEEPA
ncbi:MAG: DUF86 domain-containing protein [bacterium]